jgi:hypothetical protein
MAEFDALLAHLAAVGVSYEAAQGCIHLVGCRTADHVLETLQAVGRERWRVLFSRRYAGRPYYHEAVSNRTSWEEPDAYKLSSGRVDAATFSLSLAVVGALSRALDTLQRCGEDWPAARDTFARLLGNVTEQPNEPRYRRLNSGNAKLREALLRHAGAAELLFLTGWDAAASDGVVLLPDATPLDASRCVLARLTDAQRLTDDTGGDVAQSADDAPGELAAMMHYQRGGVHRCGSCGQLINDGSERAWTGRWDAPVGQYRYACPCGVSLCESCSDNSRPAQNAECEVPGQAHCYAPVPPFTSRLQASGAGAASESNPWGASRAAVSSRSRDRLKERTGH